jgi:hypothetical protein
VVGANSLSLSPQTRPLWTLERATSPADICDDDEITPGKYSSDLSFSNLYASRAGLEAPSCNEQFSHYCFGRSRCGQQFNLVTLAVSNEKDEEFYTTFVKSIQTQVQNLGIGWAMDCTMSDNCDAI